MAGKKKMLTREEAFQQVKSMIIRAALIHWAFTKTLVDELGEKKGKALAKKAIKLYGKEVGKRVRERTLARGLPLTRENCQYDLPALGWAEREKVQVEGEDRSRVYTCLLARVWQELRVPELGRSYCFVDQAKYEAYNPELQCIHVKNVLDGNAYCELAVRTKKKQRAEGREHRVNRKRKKQKT